MQERQKPFFLALGLLFLLPSFNAWTEAIDIFPEPEEPGVLMIVTSHDLLGNTGEKTGLWLEELALPYQMFSHRDLRVDIASPQGGTPPIDPRSLENLSEPVKTFLANQKAQAKLSQTRRLQDVAESYRAYFVVGGHGAAWDLPDNQDLQKLLSAAYDNGKVVGAVCHGPCALVNVVLANGAPLLKGKKVTGFSNAEEKAARMDLVVPFPLETRLRSAGGLYESGDLWKPHAVADGRLVTGQNPASSNLTAWKMVRLLFPPSPHDLMEEMDAAKACLQMPEHCTRNESEALEDFKTSAFEAEKALAKRYADNPVKLNVVTTMFSRLNALLTQWIGASAEKKQSLLAEINQVADEAHRAIFSR